MKNWNEIRHDEMQKLQLKDVDEITNKVSYLDTIHSITTINWWLLECLNARNIHHYNHGHSENATVTLKISFGWKFTAVDHIKEYESSKFPIYHSFLLPVTLHSFESQFLLLFYLWVMLCWCIRFFRICSFCFSYISIYVCVCV